MHTRSRIRHAWLFAAATSLTLALPAMASSPPPTSPPTGGAGQAEGAGAAKGKGRPDDARGQEGTDDAGKAKGPGAEAGQAVRDSGLDPSSQEARILRRTMLEEAKYRKQMATINRLRELATEQGNQERLAALGKMEAKLNELHERKIARAKEEIGKDKAAALEERLSKGRGKGKPDKGGVPDDAGAGKAADDSERGGRPDDAGAGKAGGKAGDEEKAGGKAGGAGGRPDDAGKGKGKGGGVS